MNDAKPTISEILDFVYSASREDRARIQQVLSLCRCDDILTARMQFRVGDWVKFEVKKRGYKYTVRGIVTQKNVKTIHVRPGDGSREWKVTASLLQKDGDAG
jgi:hypothetical protein